MENLWEDLKTDQYRSSYINLTDLKLFCKEG